MNPYGASGDIFTSQANQSANSFLDPMNMAKLYPGWGINPAYQTPAYDAPYRPGYRGPDPYAAYQRPGFLGSLSQLYNPFATTPYWGDPVSNNQNAFRALGTRPMDAMAHAGQFLAPAAVFPVMQNMFGNMGANIGSNLGRGFARGVGLNPIGGAMGAAGGFVGRYAIPLALGMPVLHTIDQGVWQPYIRSRGLSDSIQDSFSGVTFGSGGNPISGRGLSGRQAANIGTQIDYMGMRDMTFNAAQFGSIASAGMNAGLFDDVNSSGITKRVSSIAAQIKMIVAISKDPNIQTAISELAKLRMGGASIAGGVGSDAAMAFGGMGMYASAAGMSVHRMMNTVGSQAQYMYQMNGLTPYLGQLAAGGAAAGFYSAQRLGVLSQAQLARMGGVEGATQSAVAAQLSGFATPFNMMQLTNRFMGGGVGGGSLVNTVSAFGGLAARGPLALAGAMTLHGPTMMSAQAGGMGASLNLENQAMALLRASGQSPGMGGKYSPEQIAAALQGMGLPQEQIISYIQMRASQTDPQVFAQTTRAFGAQAREQSMQAISNGMLSNSFLVKAVGRPATELWQGLTSSMADIFGHSAARGAGRGKDAAANMYNWFMLDSTIGDSTSYSVGRGLDINKIRGKKGGLTQPESGMHSLGVRDSVNTKILSRIDEVARSGGEGSDLARQLLARGMKGPEAKVLFAKFLSTQDGAEFRIAEKNLETTGTIFNEVSSLADGAIIDVGGMYSPNSINSVTGMSNSYDSLRVMGEALSVYSKAEYLASDLDVLLEKPEYSGLKGALGNGSNKSKADKIKEMVLTAGKGGYVERAAVAGSLGMSLDDIINSPGKFTNNEEVQKQIISAGGDRDKVQGIVNRELRRLSGGLSTRLDLNEKGSRSELTAAFSPIAQSGLSSLQAAMNASSSGDYSKLASASAVIASGSSLFFSGAQLFTSAVNRVLEKDKSIIDKIKELGKP